MKTITKILTLTLVVMLTVTMLAACSNSRGSDSSSSADDDSGSAVDKSTADDAVVSDDDSSDTPGDSPDDNGEQSQDADNGGSNESSDAADMYVASEVTEPDLGIVLKDGIVYGADHTGVWKTVEDEKFYLINAEALYIATDGSTIIYVKKMYEPEVADFSAQNCEIHALNADGSYDRLLTKCSSISKSLLIYHNKLYYTEYQAKESFQRDLYAMDLTSGETVSVAKNVSGEVLYKNKVYYTDSSDNAAKVYDVEADTVSDAGDSVKQIYNEGVVKRYTDELYYYNVSDGNSSRLSADPNVKLSAEQTPLLYTGGILYYNDYGYISMVEYTRWQEQGAE